ncbi:uncharacterized protein LOC141725829 [Zonotrichia albicollis]|uniref:uncharacterized protein LOC141725829 n=1 Tax=Zonotrichia albicollis TaxID=44394 RepID=UPI003D80C72E
MRWQGCCHPSCPEGLQREKQRHSQWLDLRGAGQSLQPRPCHAAAGTAWRKQEPRRTSWQLLARNVPQAPARCLRCGPAALGARRERSRRRVGQGTQLPAAAPAESPRASLTAADDAEVRLLPCQVAPGHPWGAQSVSCLQRHSCRPRALPALRPHALLARQGSARAPGARCRPRARLPEGGSSNAQASGGCPCPRPDPAAGTAGGAGAELRQWGGPGREPGLALTHEPDGRLSQGLLCAPQVRQGQAQVLGRSAPVLCQLQRAAGHGGKGLMRALPLGRALPTAGAAPPAHRAPRPGQQPQAPGSARGTGPGEPRCCPAAEPGWLGAPSAPALGPEEPGAEPARPREGSGVWGAGRCPCVRHWAGATAASPTDWAPWAGGCCSDWAGHSRLSLPSTQQISTFDLSAAAA